MNIGNKATSAGTDGGRYLDEDGMTRQFTYINHDPKTTVGAVSSYPDAAAEWAAAKTSLINELMSLPPSLVPSKDTPYGMLVKRNVEEGKIEWNRESIEVMLEMNFSGVSWLKGYLKEKTATIGK